MPDSASIIDRLRDESEALTPAEVLETKGAGLGSPGLYSWWVDRSGAVDLSRGLGFEIKRGLFYAGLAGATRARSKKKSSNTLWLRMATMHLGKNHDFSTLRLSIGSVLAELNGWNAIDEVALSAWMHQHLKVVLVPVEDPDTLGQLESRALEELDPPFNLSKVVKTEQRKQLTALRRTYSKRKAPQQQASK